MRSPTALTLVLLATGCGPSDTGALAAGLSTRTDTTGPFPVTIVSGEPAAWALESLAVIRPEPNVGFANVRSIALDPAGGVWVGEMQSRLLLHFGDDGTLTETRGRQGAGPGEFTRPFALTTYRGALLLFDPGTARVTRWTPTGALDSMWDVPTITTGGTEVHWHPSADGPRFWQWALNGEQILDAYYRVPPTGTQDTILAPQGPWPTRPAEVCKDDRGSTWIWGSPFSQVRVSVPYLGGQVVNVGTDYRLAVINPAGDTVRMLVRDVPRAPVTDEDWMAGTAESRSGHDSLNLSGCTGEQVRYEFKPAITALATDEDGRLWVKRAAVGGTFWEAWRGDTLLGSVPAPPQWGGSQPSFLGDRVAVLQEGPEGGYQVGVYRIRRASEQ